MSSTPTFVCVCGGGGRHIIRRDLPAVLLPSFNKGSGWQRESSHQASILQAPGTMGLLTRPLEAWAIEPAISWSWPQDAEGHRATPCLLLLPVPQGLLGLMEH